ncbi:MAG: hypothetical protein JWP01_2220 [Myxococcales bacterium]|nr:hypothetical protein [Myxococcales bacterium]
MRSLFLIILLAGPTVALADPTPTADVSRMASDDCARARKAGKICVLTIEDQTIEGQGGGGDGTTITPITFGDMASLIRIRRDFIPEILRSAEDID